MHKIIQKSLITLVTTLSITSGFGMEHKGDDSSNPLDSVPTEIKCMVLSKLNERDLATVSQVNHEFHELSNNDEFWEELFHRNAEIAVCTKYEESIGSGCSSYDAYRSFLKNHSKLAELHPLYLTMTKPTDMSWKDHYKAVFHTPNSLNFVEISRLDVFRAAKKQEVKNKKKCVIS